MEGQREILTNEEAGLAVCEDRFSWQSEEKSCFVAEHSAAQAGRVKGLALLRNPEQL